MGIPFRPGRLAGYGAAAALIGLLTRFLYARFHIPFGTNTLIDVLVLTALARWLLLRRWDGAFAVTLSGMILNLFGAFLVAAGVVTLGLDMAGLLRTPAGMMMGFLMEHLPLLAAALWLRRTRFVLMDLGEGEPDKNRNAFRLLLAILLQTFFLMYIGIYRFTSQMPAFKNAYPTVVVDAVYWAAAVVLPVAILLFLRELDRLVRLERRLREAERQAAIGQMAAGVAHEVRNPLTAIKGHLQLLRGFSAQDDVLAGGAAGLVEDVLRQVEHVENLTGEFLLLARPRKEQREPVNLNRLAADVVETLAPMAAEAGVTLHLTGDSELPDVVGDGQRLRQVLVNLVINAVQSRPRDGWVRIETFAAAEAGRVGLRVTDTGVGIAAEHLQRIFQPFYTTKETGTGLGLAIVDRVVADHGGHVTVRSAPGDGTSFTVYLPAHHSGLTHPAPPATISPVK